jgi:hypothetical protein
MIKNGCYGADITAKEGEYYRSRRGTRATVPDNIGLNNLKLMW